LLAWIELPANKFGSWKTRYGQVNEHNGKIPRDWWLEDWEKKAIVDFHDRNPLEGYRRLTFMMLDDDIVAVSNGKLERFHGTIKKECIRPHCPRNHAEAMSQISSYIVHYNEVRLHSAIGYITPADRLCGLAEEIAAERDRKLEEARARRRRGTNEERLAIAG